MIKLYEPAPFLKLRLTIGDRGVEMAKDNSCCCEFLARAKDYQGWSNAEQPLVQGLARASRRWQGLASHLSDWHQPLICQTFNYCPTLPGHAH